MEASAPSAAPRPLRADARRNRERLLEAARRVFARDGGFAQMETVAREAGVGVGTVYRHFPTKDALMGELIRLKFLAIAEDLRERLAHEGDPWEDLAGVIVAQAERMADHAGEQELMWTASDEAFDVAREAKHDVEQLMGQLIARAQTAGVVRPDFTPADVGPVFCALGSVMRNAPRHDGEEPWRGVLQLLLDGLRAAPSRT